MTRRAEYLAYLVDRGLQAVERRISHPRQVQRAVRLLNLALARGEVNPDIVRHLQAIRLRRTVAYAARHSPFYRQMLAGLNIAADDIRSSEDLTALPFTTARDLRDWPRFLCVPETTLSAVFTTAGSTGEPKRIYYTFNDLQALINFSAISLRLVHGSGRLVALIALPLGHGLWMGAVQAVRTVERAGGLALPVGLGPPAETLAWMRRFAPNVIMSSPSYMVTLTEEARRQNYRPLLSKLMLGGEPLTAAVRTALTDYWRADVADVYGSTEIGGGQAISLPGGEGMVLNEFHLFVEIVDPLTGRSADEGELVFTTFSREAMPLIRYRSGDRARWLEGRPWLHLRGIRLLGRLDDMLVVGDMNLYGQVIADRLAELPGSSGRVEIVVDKVNLTDRLRVRVTSPDAEAVRQALFSLYPEMAEAIRVGYLRLEIETGADLTEQLKGLRLRDLRAKA